MNAWIWVRKLTRAGSRGKDMASCGVCFVSSTSLSILSPRRLVAMSVLGRKQPFAVNLNERQEWGLANPKADGPLSANGCHAGHGSYLKINFQPSQMSGYRIP